MKFEHLTSKPFIFGQSDCFSLARAFYKDNFDIDVEDYARPTDWDADQINLIEACFEREGFDKITTWKPKDLRPGDVLCMSIGTAAPNHLAVFLGDNQMVHHLVNRFSTDEPYRDFWQNFTCFILRHPDVPDLRPVLPDKDIEEILRERLNFMPQSEG